MRAIHLSINGIASALRNEETRSIMEMQSERLHGETKAVLILLTEHLVGKLLEAGEMSLNEALFEIRSFEAG